MALRGPRALLQPEREVFFEEDEAQSSGRPSCGSARISRGSMAMHAALAVPGFCDVSAGPSGRRGSCLTAESPFRRMSVNIAAMDAAALEQNDEVPSPDTAQARRRRITLHAFGGSASQDMISGELLSAMCNPDDDGVLSSPSAAVHALKVRAARRSQEDAEISFRPRKSIAVVDVGDFDLEKGGEDDPLSGAESESEHVGTEYTRNSARTSLAESHGTGDDGGLVHVDTRRQSGFSELSGADRFSPKKSLEDIRSIDENDGPDATGQAAGPSPALAAPSLPDESEPVAPLRPPTSPSRSRRLRDSILGVFGLKAKRAASHGGSPPPSPSPARGRASTMASGSPADLSPRSRAQTMGSASAPTSPQPTRPARRRSVTQAPRSQSLKVAKQRSKPSALTKDSGGDASADEPAVELMDSSGKTDL